MATLAMTLLMATTPIAERTWQRQKTLVDYGATESEVVELLAYNQNIFVHHSAWNKSPEPHVTDWQGYITDAAQVGAWESLRRRLVQLRFKVEVGMSEDPAYYASTRRGATIPAGTTGLELRSPQQLQLFIHQTWAGPIPVIFTADRCDFQVLVQALARRNEPIPVPAAMGACMVSGFNNWDRVRSYRTMWEAQRGNGLWPQDWQRLLPQKSLYQDRFIILSDSPYSNVSATDLGLTEDIWQQQSRQIRLEHESIHYWTKRRLGSMQNNLLDELIADYWGLVAATGEYQADWFLRFLGLESWPLYRASGRLANYCGNPPLSAKAFEVLRGLVVIAARNLEQAHRLICPFNTNDACYLVEALSYLTLEELATHEAVELLTELTMNLKNNFS